MATIVKKQSVRPANFIVVGHAVTKKESSAPLGVIRIHVVVRIVKDAYFVQILVEPAK